VFSSSSVIGLPVEVTKRMLDESEEVLEESSLVSFIRELL
jgi:hypothetical protein